MKKRFLPFLMFAVLGWLVTPVWADLLYDNYTINDVYDGGWLISDTESADHWVSNSFTLSQSSVLTEVQIGLWVYTGRTPSSVGWAIGNLPNATEHGLGTASLTSTDSIKYYNNYNLYVSTFSLDLTLGPGTYWLTLQDGLSTEDYIHLYWDISNGPSSAVDYQGDLTNRHYEGTNSSSFQIYGTTATSVPEPSTMLLLGSGLIGLWGLRRKIKK